MSGRIVKVNNNTLPSVMDWWTQPDVLAMLLAEKRSQSTRRAYDRDIQDFFAKMFGVESTAEWVVRFLALPGAQALGWVVKYKAKMIEQGLSEATVNRRLSALRALVHKGRVLGVCGYTLEDIKGETVIKYRDTSGVTPQEFKQILLSCDRTTAKGVRDYALLRLLWDNALRRGEIAKLKIGDFDRKNSKLLVLGKGRGSQQEIIDLTPKTRDAICYWLPFRGLASTKDALFVALDLNTPGHPLSDTGLAKMVRTRALKAGITKPLSPHRIRHSSITAALDAGQSVREVQKLSRHSKLETLMIYDDNRQQHQLKVSSVLADLV
ncbi:MULTISPECIES: tyrosine-type recombinase/integrase [Nostoc]|uniref:Tyrosine-type recombinase/integrase n=1 Tax=Nostoc paludosum FACHB-159 TaxID=2692908 RepID=A0ABR8KF07_9NOSO|nr:MULTISPECIES: tyrosine-type recombinase/integrase [Nostoc]MBD2680935.1 tyrosine-type recombinase/integrase [Nostoc sp. FACHB-857]MBD2737411.1 tyrosine-type recombinase/integrase [Nostoc paludosum FACHB-159]